jgi:hypothetical protein
MLKKPWDNISDKDLSQHICNVLEDSASKDKNETELMRVVREEIIELTESQIDFDFLINNTHEIHLCFKKELIQTLEDYRKKVIASPEFQLFIEKKVEGICLQKK